ncbi:MAG: gliding motility-associated C-terminal domain-containing protein, partial [Gemmatimonadota bacterium]|nr:gliding motility-associated C-terminal domain-containing protein [Gemmatimonadota bacterium]
EGIVFFDLGAFYWIDAFRLAYGGSPFKDYRLDFSDGSLEADGSLKWTTTGTRQTSAPTAVGSKWESETNLRFGTYEGNDFERVKARFFRLVWEQIESATARGGATGQPAEIQLYGRGYHPEVALTSNLIRLGGSRNLLSIAWDADTPPGTSVVLQTRTGNELDEVLRYFKKDGTEVTEDEYNKLLSIFRGDTVGEEVAGGDWSDWSAPYEDASGSPITSPSPRAYLEVRAVLRSDTPDHSATLRAIRLHFTNPVAQGLSGEVTPFAVEQLGQPQRFSLYVRPQFAADDPGFDQLLVVAPSDMRLAFEGVYGGSAEALAAEVGADWALDGAEVVPTSGDSLQVAFSAIDPSSEVEVVRLDFSTALFSTGAVLQASLQNSVEGEGGWQRVDPGEAVEAIASNTTTLVGTVASGPLVQAVSVVPSVFTPNGDGINDEASFRFTVVKVGDDSPVEVLIYDLQGRLVRRLVEQRALSTGSYGVAWDGRDEQGDVAPPGVYLARLRVDTDTEGSQIGNAEIFRTIAVAY